MEGKTIIDITRPIQPSMAIYPGNPAVEVGQVQPATATQSGLSRISIGSHTGTHIDAPSHIDAEGTGTDSYGLDQLNGAAEVVDLTQVSNVITAADIATVAAARVLFRTRNSTTPLETFDPEFVALDDSAAEALVASGVTVVGIDGPSIKKKGQKDRVHTLFLEAGVVIIEGLYMPEVAAGSYELLCLPLSLEGVDGAPVRAALRK